ncbi:hypothetical protein QBC47DRAFT_377218 [Echria macrotheca]|uniref:BHLH domain-containing protein n=1 Tax=Echria macrotheca TaxID=438768 RepID=A0AAJ0BGM2_9PEZI|nr:hypothetical protein QBC47DRAFT_377218 [Echria macrotheca]
MEREPDYHFDQNPSEGFLSYQVAASTFGPGPIAPFRLPTPSADDHTTSAVLYFGNQPQNFLPSPDDFPYNETCQATNLRCDGFSESMGTSLGVLAYDGSSLESWSPITPATPAGVDSLTGCFSTVHDAICFAESISPSPPTGRTLSGSSWASSYAPTDYIQAGFQARSAADFTSLTPLHQVIYQPSPTHVPQALPQTEEKATATIEEALTVDNNERPAHSRDKEGGRKKRRSMSFPDLGDVPDARDLSTRRDSPKPTGGANHTLRTAARKNKPRKPTSKPGESAQEHRTRTCHNQVEKEYRNRLHGSFAKLLEVLPDEGRTGSGEGSETAGQQPTASGRKTKRVSKAEVLEKACLRLEMLMDGNSKRKREIAELEERLKAAGAKGG